MGRVSKMNSNYSQQFMQQPLTSSSSCKNKCRIDEDSKIQALGVIASLGEEQKYFTRVTKDRKVQVVSLTKDAGLFDKIVFTLSKALTRSNAAFRAVFDLDYAGLDKGDQKKYEQALHKVKRAAQSNVHFYKSVKSIKQNAKLRKSIREAEAKIGRSMEFTKSDEASVIATVRSKKRELNRLDNESAVETYAAMTLGALPNTYAETAHFYNQGGSPIITTAHEVEALKSILGESQSSSVAINEKDREELERYLDVAERSLNVNYLIYAQRNSPSDSAFAFNLAVKKAHHQVRQLKAEESVFLDVGYAQHSMRLVITKSADERTFHLNLFDTCGALELMEGSISSGLKGLLLGKEQRVVMAIDVEAEKFDTHGLDYLAQLFSFETSEFSSIMENQSPVANYLGFLRVFKSMPGTKVLKSSQQAQEAQNCFDKRVEAAQRYYLNAENFMRVRQKYLEMAGQKLLEGACKVVEPPESSQEELKKYVNSLSKEQIPTGEEMARLRKAILSINEMPKDLESWKLIFQYIQFQQNILSH